MVEKKDRRIRIPESEITKIDLELLSFAEHAFIGSGVSLNGASGAPLSPLALIKQEMNTSAMFHMREAQRWVRSNPADLELLGVEKVERFTVLFQLSDFDVVSGEIDGLPALYGVYDSKERRIIKNKDELASLGVSEERARNFAEAKIGHFFPNGTFTTDRSSQLTNSL